MAKVRETKTYQVLGCIPLWKTVHIWEEAGEVSELCSIKTQIRSKLAQAKQQSNGSKALKNLKVVKSTKKSNTKQASRKQK